MRFKGFSSNYKMTLYRHVEFRYVACFTFSVSYFWMRFLLVSSFFVGSSAFAFKAAEKRTRLFLEESTDISAHIQKPGRGRFKHESGLVRVEGHVNQRELEDQPDEERLDLENQIEKDHIGQPGAVGRQEEYQQEKYHQEAQPTIRLGVPGENTLDQPVVDLGPRKDKALNLNLPEAIHLGGKDRIGLSSPHGDEGYKLIIVINNDVLTEQNTDRHLTSRVSVGALTQNIPKHLKPFIDSEDYLLMTLSHEIYTPEDLKSFELVEDERPYAGYLYLTLGRIEESSNQIKVTSIDIGVVGPSAQADFIQTEFHRIFGGTEVNGWGNQLNDEIGLNLHFDAYNTAAQGPLGSKGQFLENISWELLRHHGFSIGTVNTSLRAGMALRVGRRIPEDKGWRFSLKDPEPRWRAYGSLKASGEIVLHNIFLDGNSDGQSHSVEKETLVGEVSAGITFQKGAFGVTLEQSVRSEEFTLQKGSDFTGGFQLIFDMYID